MSEPVTNIEIEDVLSSIRRLVSDEARTPLRRSTDVGFRSNVPPEPVEIEAENEVRDMASRPSVSAPALVLTPALRVEENNIPEPAADLPEEQSQDSEEQPREPALILPQEAHSGESDTDNAIETAELHSEEGVVEIEEAEGEMLCETLEAVQADDMAEQEDTTVQDNDAAQDDDIQSSDQPAEDYQEPLTIEDKIAALETIISRSDTDFEPDGSGDGANAARKGAALPWEDAPDTQTRQFDDVMLDPESASQSASFNEGAIAFEQAHAEAVDTAQAEVEANTVETLLGNDDAGAILDEDALRDMVAEIVRQELQGPLGERITRNVRKLVRREIYRALAANELD